MKKGSSRFGERVGVFLNVEKSVRDLARHLKLTDTEAYTKGVLSTADERVSELDEQQFGISIQKDREQLKDIQDRIALKERVSLDLRIRAEARMKKKTVVLTDRYGKPMVDRKGEPIMAGVSE